MKLLILSLFSITISAAQQAKIDSLRQVLAATKEDTIKKPILESLGHLYREERKLDSSIQSYQLALEIVQNKKNGYPAVQEEYTLGILDFLTNATGNYSMSMTYATRALQLSEKLQYDKGRAFALACIATNYSGMGDLKTALVYFFRSKEAFELYESGHWAIQNIAETYLKMHQLDSALYFNRIAYHIADTGHHQEYMKAFALRIFAYIYADKNDDTTAMKYYRSFVNDFNTYNLNNREIGHTFLGMARLFLKNRRLDSAIYYSKKSLESARIYNDQQYIYNSSELLYSLYDSLQDQKEAFRYYKIAAAAKDSMASLEKARNIQNLSFNEQVREKEKREVDAKERARTRLAISISAIVLFIISFLIWNRIRQLRLRHRMIWGRKKRRNSKPSIK